MLQLTVKVININLSEAHPILGKCRPLYEYSCFIAKIQEYLGTGASRDEAIREAMEASVRQGIMTKFITKHGSEVRNMLFTEFNLDDAKEVWWEEGREEGRNDILVELISKKLKKGKSPKVIADELESDIEKVERICCIADAYAPDYDPKEILKAVERKSR